MKSFEEALQKQPIKIRGSKCRVCEVLADMKPKDREALTKALAASKDVVPATLIHRALVELGYELSAGTVRYHRTGSCRGAK